MAPHHDRPASASSEGAEILPTDLFANRLRAERERQGISQAELARRMETWLGTNLGQTAILRMEQRTRAVRLDEAVAAAKVLGVPLIALISEDPVRENDQALQERLADLAVAEQEWERQRHTIEQITRHIQQLTAQRRQLIRDHAAEVAADEDPTA